MSSSAAAPGSSARVTGSEYAKAEAYPDHTDQLGYEPRRRILSSIVEI
jgi:hypothetical protein